jgi:hypothetical protein
LRQVHCGVSHCQKKKPNLSVSYARQVERRLDGDAFPYIRAVPIRDVTTAHLLEIMRRLEARGAETIALQVPVDFSDL